MPPSPWRRSPTCQRSASTVATVSRVHSSAASHSSCNLSTSRLILNSIPLLTRSVKVRRCGPIPGSDVPAARPRGHEERGLAELRAVGYGPLSYSVFEQGWHMELRRLCLPFQMAGWCVGNVQKTSSNTFLWPHQPDADALRSWFGRSPQQSGRAALHHPH